MGSIKERMAALQANAGGSQPASEAPQLSVRERMAELQAKSGAAQPALEFRRVSSFGRSKPAPAPPVEPRRIASFGRREAREARRRGGPLPQPGDPDSALAEELRLLKEEQEAATIALQARFAQKRASLMAELKDLPLVGDTHSEADST